MALMPAMHCCDDKVQMNTEVEEKEKRRKRAC